MSAIDLIPGADSDLHRSASTGKRLGLSRITRRRERVTAQNEKTEAKYDVSLNYPDLDLHSAAAGGNVGLVHYALTHGQPVNSVLHGVLPIHAACAGGSEPIVRMLIDRGADVNAPRLPRRYTFDPTWSSPTPTSASAGVSGSTALHFAAANGHVKIVKILLACGAVHDKRDKQGNTPASLAEVNGHQEVVNLLVMWGGLIEDERERAMEEEHEENRRERELHPDAEGSTRNKRLDSQTKSQNPRRAVSMSEKKYTPSSSRRTLDRLNRKEPPSPLDLNTDTFYMDVDSLPPSPSSATSHRINELRSSQNSRRPSLPSIFEKASHPGTSIRNAFRRQANSEDPSGRIYRDTDDDAPASVSAGAGHLSRQSLTHLFRRGRDNSSPLSESPSPPLRTSNSLPPAPEDLEQSIEKLRRTSLDGASLGSKYPRGMHRSGSQAIYNTALETKVDEVNPNESPPPSSPLVKSYTPNDPSSEDDSQTAGKKPKVRPSLERIETQIKFEVNGPGSLEHHDPHDGSLVDSPVHNLALLPDSDSSDPWQRTLKSEPSSPTKLRYEALHADRAEEMRRSPSEGPQPKPRIMRMESNGSNRGRQIRLSSGRSRGASFSSVASSIIALQQLDGKTIAIFEPPAHRDPNTGRQRSISSSSSAFSGSGFAPSIAGTSWTPPSTLSSHENGPQSFSPITEDEHKLPRERLSRKLSRQKSQTPTLLYNVPSMSPTEGFSRTRQVSSREEAHELVVKTEQDILGALNATAGSSSLSLAEQLAAYGDSLALEEEFNNEEGRPHLVKMDSADSNITVTTEGSRMTSARRSYISNAETRPYKDAASSFSAMSSDKRSLQGGTGNISRRQSDIYVPQVPPIPSINRIYESRAAAYRDKGLALKHSAPIYLYPSGGSRQASGSTNGNAMDSHWLMTAAAPRREHRSSTSAFSSPLASDTIKNGNDSDAKPSRRKKPGDMGGGGKASVKSDKLSGSFSTTTGSPQSQDTITPFSAIPPSHHEGSSRHHRDGLRQSTAGISPFEESGMKSRHSPPINMENLTAMEGGKKSSEGHSVDPLPERHLLKPDSDIPTSANHSKHSRWGDLKFRSPFTRHK